MLESFVAGVFAGFGVAIPVGAIAVLIIETAARHGLRTGLAAGAGAATADGLYALLAALFGLAIAALVEPFTVPLRVAAVAVLVALALRGLLALRRDGVATDAPDPATPPGGRTYGQFLGLTLLNPMTVAYFAALILGLPGIGASPLDKAVFTAGAFLSSLSWQSLLAVFGAILHRHASGRLRAATSVVGNLIILGFAARIAMELLPG